MGSVLHGRLVLAKFALSLGFLGKTDGFRTSQIVHSVHNMDRDRDFGSPSLLCMRSKGVADDTPVSTKPRRLYPQESDAALSSLRTILKVLTGHTTIAGIRNGSFSGRKFSSSRKP